MKQRIYLSPPHMGGNEINYVKDAFQKNWIAPIGPHLNEFENALATYNDTPNCVALSSGTAAIHLALIVMGVSASDEVLCSSFTFAGSCNPIAYLGADPVFIDSESETWNMDPELLEKAIKQRMAVGKKPKAIIVVHLYGMPARIEEIMNISVKYEIPVIEDAAEALGSELNGKKLGTFGDIGIYSFNGNKIITTSGGGALISDRSEYVTKARFLSTQAREPAPHYEHLEIGYNYRLSNISAAIGLGQMEILNDRIETKRRIFSYYANSVLRDLGFSFLTERRGAFSNRWLTTAVLQNDTVTIEDIRSNLEKQNIESRPLWKPMHLQPVYAKCTSFLNGVSERLFERGLCLPSGSELKKEDLDRIIQAIEDVMK